MSTAFDTCRAAHRMWERLHWQQCFDFEELDTEPLPIPAAPAFVRFSGDALARQRPENLLAGRSSGGAYHRHVPETGAVGSLEERRPASTHSYNGRSGSPSWASAAAATGGER